MEEKPVPPPSSTEEQVTEPNVAPVSGPPVIPVTPLPVPPVKVTVVAPPAPVLVAKGEGVTLAPTTTEADDKVIAGRQRINILWEAVQATIAISVTIAIIYLAIVQTPAETITNAFFLIVGFYFSRTNHERPGPTGKSLPYEGG